MIDVFIRIKMFEDIYHFRLPHDGRCYNTLSLKYSAVTVTFFQQLYH